MIILIQSDSNFCLSLVRYQQIWGIDLCSFDSVICWSYDHWKQIHAIAHTSTADMASCREKSSILIMGRWWVSSVAASLHSSVISDHIVSVSDSLPDRVLMNVQQSNKTWYSMYYVVAISLLQQYQSRPWWNQIQAETASLISSELSSQSEKDDIFNQFIYSRT